MTVFKDMTKPLDLKEEEDETLKDKLIELKEQTNNRLKQAVIDSVLSYFSDDDEIKTYIEDVLNYGCVSGCVGDLIYYSQTTAFYQKYKEEIFELAYTQAQDIGYKSASDLFRHLNGAKELESIDQEENLRAWFGFEEMLRLVAYSLELEV